MLNRAPAAPGENLNGELTRAHEQVQRRTMFVLIITQVIGTIGVGIAPSIGILLASEVTSSETWAGLARTASTLGAALMACRWEPSPPGLVGASRCHRAGGRRQWAASSSSAPRSTA